ncbi:olfactory receptor 49-like [Larimichthys crocea]|uniref:olfactory receptor 49-like n=1 Tax=Larimichthys crocea TaxID=215358 RepID=UPI000F5FB449|nr:olfactory receptor 49-like [Larimichthys crocea]
MDNESNVTYITLGGHVEIYKYRYLYFLMTFLVYILIICCNFIVMYIIWSHQNLHEPMYIFIAALLMNSSLLSTAIYPKLLIDFLSDRQVISYSACLFQFYIYYSVGGSEFLLLAAMSYDRYVSICKPLQYPTVMTKTTVSLLLFFTWLVPACHIAIPTILSADTKLCDFTVKAIFCNNAVYKLHCVRSKVITIYGVFTLLDLAILPVLFIIFTYTKILIISYRSGREVRKKAAETCLPHMLVLISFSCLTAYDVSIARVQSDFPNTVRLIMMVQ